MTGIRESLSDSIKLGVKASSLSNSHGLSLKYGRYTAVASDHRDQGIIERFIKVWVKALHFSIVMRLTSKRERDQLNG